MYNFKNVTYIFTCLESIEKLFIYTRGIESAEELLHRDDQLVFNACQTLLLTIGEETKKIDGLLRQEFDHIPWRQIAELRNRIAHDYRSLNPHISFDVIKNYLPPLKNTLIAMLGRVDYPMDKYRKVLSTPYYRHLHYLLPEEE